MNGGNETKDAAQRQIARRKQIEALAGDGRKCPKCGGAMGHYRLHGIRCLNLKCAGPYGGGKGS